MLRILGCFGIVGLLLFGIDCRPAQGERCNPLLFNTDDQCSEGLSCIYPNHCGVAYCCPPPDMGTPATDPNCQACPAPDGGTTG